MTVKISRILVPVDGSEAALQGLRFAETIAQANQASLDFIHVLDGTIREVLKIDGVSEASFGGLSATELEALVRRYVADPYFEAAKAVMNNPHIELELHTATGSPSAEICRYAREIDADLIVLGARGASDFKELLLGSVASQVVHHAPCAVTVVR